MRLVSPEFFETVGMYIRKFQDTPDNAFQELLREAESEFSLLLDDVESCCALCARIEAWRSIALSLRDLTCEDDRLSVETSSHHETISWIRTYILPPLCLEQRELFESELCAFNAAFPD